MMSIAFVGVMWLGLKAVYLDSATFGKPQDYLGLVAWGALTQGSLDGINAVLGKIGPTVRATPT